MVQDFSHGPKTCSLQTANKITEIKHENDGCHNFRQKSKY